MSFSTLECFKQTADSGSMRKAAERLGIPQPAVRKKIDQLEEETGKVLFIRNQSGCVLTADGQTLYDYVESILLIRDEYLEKSGSSNQKKPLTIRISTVRGLASTMCGRWISGFAASSPDVHFQLTTGSSDEIAYRLEHSLCEIGVISKLEKKPVFLDGFAVGKERVAVFMSETGPLAGEKEPISLKKLVNQKLIIPIENAVMKENLQAFPQKVGKNVLCRTSNFSAAEEIVGSGMAIGLYPESFFQGRSSWKICKKQLEPKTAMSYYMVWNNEHGISGIVAQFIDYVKEKSRSELDE